MSQTNRVRGRKQPEGGLRSSHPWKEFVTDHCLVCGGKGRAQTDYRYFRPSKDDVCGVVYGRKVGCEVYWSILMRVLGRVAAQCGENPHRLIKGFLGTVYQPGLAGPSSFLTEMIEREMC